MDYLRNVRERFGIGQGPDEGREAGDRARQRVWTPFHYVAAVGCGLVLIVVVAWFAFKKSPVASHPDCSRFNTSINDRDIFNTTITAAEMQSLMDYNESMIYKGPPRQLPWPSNALTEEEKMFKKEIEEADHPGGEAGFPKNALELYQRLLEKLPHSFRANYGIARVYESYAYADNRTLSLEYLHNASIYYTKALEEIHENVEDNIRYILYINIASLCLDIGDKAMAMNILEKQMNVYPNDTMCKTRHAEALAKTDSYYQAIRKYQQILETSPDHGPTLRKLGYLMYTHGKWDEALEYLSKGAKDFDKARVPGRYYQALGDTLQRLQRRPEAFKYYKDAASKHILRSMFQRSYDNIDHLTGKPWWSVEEMNGSMLDPDKDMSATTGTVKDFFRKLRSMTNVLRREVINALALPDHNYYFDLIELTALNSPTDTIREAVIFSEGYKTPKCRKFPQTVRLFNTFPPTRRCNKCSVKYLLIKKGYVWPPCSSTNTILTTHLALSVPHDEVFLTVHNESRTWTEGDVLIFDASFENEISTNGTGFLILLSFDLRHPELHLSEMYNLRNFIH